MRRITRGRKQTSTIEARHSIGMKYQFLRQDLRLYPANCARRWVEGMDAQPESLNQVQIKRNIFPYSHTVYNTGLRYSFRRHTPTCAFISQRDFANPVLYPLPKLLPSKS